MSTPNAFNQFVTAWVADLSGNDDLQLASAAWDEALLKVSEAILSDTKNLPAGILARIQCHISSLHTWRPGELTTTTTARQ